MAFSFRCLECESLLYVTVFSAKKIIDYLANFYNENTVTNRNLDTKNPDFLVSGIFIVKEFKNWAKSDFKSGVYPLVENLYVSK